MNRLISLIACGLFGLTQIMIYIRLPIVDTYGTRDIFILPTSLLGLILTIDKKWGKNLLAILHVQALQGFQ